ncbi:MAG: K(+)-transporting ATPase subunit F [Ignavibacteria bacterium]|nr:K(+)-transporting ATPase subunit F [Ignavibacteria bacterium]MCU7497970.1 K(+)-transporting ATPase subunit F [Ignavibacteria bacterium]MCU7511744.1 K(+)-transporting ATPase subunit F [Ignavibacteria bacterium]MCU7519818.1 K(+)-transporting ATPase subunit F [Ignavibacteria bacterium]MCU7523684.1 K(+)-transporting ATPase subunit F [Ignavibacteria bacterium]
MTGEREMIILLILCFAVGIYLTYALIKPEKF